MKQQGQPVRPHTWLHIYFQIKFIYSDKATKFCKIPTGTTWDKSTVEISQNVVAFSEYMNFIINLSQSGGVGQILPTIIKAVVAPEFFSHGSSLPTRERTFAKPRFLISYLKIYLYFLDSNMQNRGNTKNSFQLTHY